MILNEDDDFGFSAVSEDELKQAEQQMIAENSSAVKDLQTRLDKMYKAILPLLANLEKNPEKEYILWPGRDKKIKEFRTKLKNIYEGSK